MTKTKIVYCYFWIKAVDTKGQILDDQTALTGAASPDSASLATTDNPTTVWSMPNMSIATTDNPTTVWAMPTDGATLITVTAVENAAVARDKTATSLATSCITLNQRYDTEEKARKWIDSDQGKSWRGNAQLCVLHRIAVKLESN